MSEDIQLVGPCDELPFKISEKFRDRLRPLDGDERQELMLGLNQYGCLEPVLGWKEERILLDGHNRVSICADLSLEYRIRWLTFKDENAAMLFVVRHQLGRRNTTPAERVALALSLKPAIEAKAKARQVAAGGDRKSDQAKSLPQQIGESDPKPVETNAEIAKLAGVSTEQVRKVETVLKSAAPEVKDAMIAGTTSIAAAYKTTKPPSEKPSVARPAVEQPTETADRSTAELTLLLFRSPDDGEAMAAPHRKMYRADFDQAFNVLWHVTHNFGDLFGQQKLSYVLRNLLKEVEAKTPATAIGNAATEVTP